MLVEELESTLIEELGYDDTPEFKSSDEIMWVNGRKIPNISHAYLINNSPIAYFSRLSELDPDAIQQLHKNVWSQTKAPMLFVTLPNEIRVYNTYDHHIDEDGNYNAEATLIQHLDGLNEALTVQKKIEQQLVGNAYQRIYIETGAFWNTKEGKRYTDSGRADKRLIDSMVEMRKQLVDAGLTYHIAYTLLGRSIFIRYLEDRGVLTEKEILEWTEGKADNYYAALSSHATTYQLFVCLTAQFNGDLFPIEDEENIVSQSHLDIIAQFLSGSDLRTGQLSLFPFNFEYIPIELISNVYDTFIEKEQKRKSGSYYTPLSLVDFILEETMGVDTIHPDMKILDPACGSGIFLVGAFRRLITAWSQTNNHQDPTPDDLITLLQNNIFGVDINGEAVRIATFSLYLEILNHLDNIQINHNFKFPSIRQSNFLSCDFFSGDVDEKFEKGKFDRIIGNLPWGRQTITPPAITWLNTHKSTVGGKQIAPVFILRAPKFCKEHGEIAFLAPTKSTILVSSDTHQEFRKQFFQNYNVRAVVNFSGIRKELFENAISPSSAIFYQCNEPDDKKIIYATPKPSPLSRCLKAIVLASNEIKFLDKVQLQEFPHLWKVALWGTHRDSALIERLSLHCTLNEMVQEKGGSVGEGVQIGGGDENSAPWLDGLDWIPTKKFRPYKIDLAVCKPENKTVYHRPRTANLFQPPLLLIHQSTIKAAFCETKLAYGQKISSVAGYAGNENILKWLGAYINSDLARYYHFLTSTCWAVERENIIQREYEEMPVPVPKSDEDLQKVVAVYNQIVEILDDERLEFQSQKENQIAQLQGEINQMMYEAFHLHPVEIQQVQDTLQYGLGFFEWAKSKRRKYRSKNPVKRPTPDMLKQYAEIFAAVSTSMLKYRSKYLKATVFSNHSPLTVIAFDIMTGEKPKQFEVSVEKSSGKLREALRTLDKLALKQKTPSLYVQRHVRVYDGDRMYLVRPSERRFWTESQARADADNWIASLME